MTYILGIDTSAYTTSIALINEENNEILADERKILEVKQGQKGLRQQEAVFQHLKNLPELYSKITHDLSKINTVSVSSRPRNEEDSYMPVFIVGRNFGKVISHTLNCELFEYSHQENHISSSLIDNYKNVDEFLAVHISGGTTEFVSAKKSIKGFETKIVGQTKDITFGQLIDRLGIMMDFPFPCGKYMEEYIKGKNVGKLTTPRIIKGSYINLSGMENYFGNLLNKYTKEEIITSLFDYIAEYIVQVIYSLSHLHHKTLIISGGVASNSYIRNYIMKSIKGYEILFPAVNNSSDNAVGLAFLPIIDRWYNEIKTY
jgi:N6-L-threonylcarbamoyladenine synthase